MSEGALEVRLATSGVNQMGRNQLSNDWLWQLIQSLRLPLSLLYSRKHLNTLSFTQFKVIKILLSESFLHQLYISSIHTLYSEEFIFFWNWNLSIRLGTDNIFLYHFQSARRWEKYKSLKQTRPLVLVLHSVPSEMWNVKLDHISSQTSLLFLVYWFPFLS